MLLVIDNYDSFTWNLVQYAGELGAEPVVVRNDQETVDQLLARRPQAILISPGPCTPLEAGVSVPLIRRAAGRVPILGVCLGHQAIGEAFGGRVVRAGRLMHGKTTLIAHAGTELFDGVANPVSVMRYHSLVVAPEGLPPELETTAWSTDRARAGGRRSWRSGTGGSRSGGSSSTPNRSGPKGESGSSPISSSWPDSAPWPFRSVASKFISVKLLTVGRWQLARSGTTFDSGTPFLYFPRCASWVSSRPGSGRPASLTNRSSSLPGNLW